MGNPLIPEPDPADEFNLHMESTQEDASGSVAVSPADISFAAAIALACAGVCYPAVNLLRYMWTSSEFYGHAYAVPAVAAYLLYRNRAKIRVGFSDLQPPLLGAPLLFAVAALEGIAILGDIGFGAAVGIPFLLAATAFAIGGRRLLTPMALPLVFLILMVPPPAFLLDQVLIQLKFFVTDVSVNLLQTFGQVISARGNQVMVPGHTLFVADACSGLTSIVTLLPLSAIVAFFLSHGIWRRLVVVGSVIPLAVSANIFRVTLTVLLVSSYGGEFAEGMLHETFGLGTYIAGTLALIGVAKVLR
ncbi:MAG: exosortase/archaeosortase family protein [bacterium]|nr:exosortase/archaeosortase family protein [bacterium]